MNKNTSRFLKFGLPFFLLVIGGSFGLRKISQVRYDYRKQEKITPEEAAEFGVKMKPAREVTIEKEFSRLQNMNIDTWENKRGPRPWEENNASMIEINQKQKEKKDAKL